ncbi:MAG: alkaline phosphatase D family protein [Hyphomonadaceae bacterium]|nr:alkaline phosphatase D family protein [Hyphomonadaceae bacterium]
MHPISRRTFVGAAASLPAATAASAAAADFEHARTVSRIAFGSCAKGDKPQPIWDAVLAAQPDLFIFLGDNVYLDTRDPEVMRRKYAELAAQPGFQRLRAHVPILAIWDDHDFGENDAGREYPMKEEARRQFLEFFNEPASSPRWSRDGIYTSYMYGPPGQRAQIILPDLRWNRTPLNELELGGQDYEAWAEARAHQGLSVPGGSQSCFSAR